MSQKCVTYLERKDERMDKNMGLINDMVGFQLTDVHKMHDFHGSVKIKLFESSKLFFPPLVIKGIK